MKQEITILRKETKQERAARMLDALIFGEDEKPQPPQETEQERITKMIEGILIKNRLEINGADTK